MFRCKGVPALLRQGEQTQDASYLARPMLEETRDLANNSHAPGGEGGILRQLHNLDLDVTVNKDKGYLEGCRIFLSGFSALEQETLKKIVNNGGGMRLDLLSTRVTHIVTKVTILKEIENLVSLHPDAAVLSPDWLIRSMEKGAQEPEHKYDLVPTTDHVTPDNPLPTIRPVRPTNQSGSDSILDQYRTTNTNSDVTVLSRDVTVLSRDVTMTSGDVTASVTTNDTTGAAVDRTQAQNASMVIKSDLFKSYKFYIPTNVPTKIARNVQQQIIAHGGCCRQDNIDFCVVDPFQEQPPCCPDKTHVTYMWLQRCIQAGVILSVSDCILFSPRHVPNPCHVLRGCVICYTQFSGFELAHLVKLVEALGGVCQGTFTQKTIKNHKRMPDCLACTHIIYKRKELESSNKIKAAMKWNIPAVKIDWLYNCLETVSKVDSKLYEDTDMLKSNEVKREEVLEECARKIAEEMPRGVSGVTIKKNGVLKHDEEGFVTPMKIKLNKLIKVEAAMEALESPAPVHDTTISSLNTVYKRNIANAMKRTAPPSKVLGGVTLVVKQNKQVEVPVSE
ncbi:DNA topoisomerase 2-binding protein 1-A-like [Bolinopsis microptera]|uniref:DNA topoisomerase 2-binding protein 1-A-like n=1 Tax=Bolinopsis microptera TaxID=2820187 RepID=UPI00307ACB87